MVLSEDLAKELDEEVAWLKSYLHAKELTYVWTEEDFHEAYQALEAYKQFREANS